MRMRLLKKLIRAAVRALIGEQRIQESVKRIREQRFKEHWAKLMQSGGTIRREPKRWPVT